MSLRTKTPQSAAVVYGHRVDRAAFLLKEIANGLAAHKLDAGTVPGWGSAGELGHVCSLLEEVSMFLGAEV